MLMLGRLIETLAEMDAGFMRMDAAAEEFARRLPFGAG